MIAASNRTLPPRPRLKTATLCGRVNRASRTNRHSGFIFLLMCDSWASGLVDLEADDVEAEAIRTYT